VSILWILIPAPFVGYLVAQWCRTAFSDDPGVIHRLVREQPVTMLTGLTMIGALATWALSELGRRIFFV
jgi:hypothetical protein